MAIPAQVSLCQYKEKNDLTILLNYEKVFVNWFRQLSDATWKIAMKVWYSPETADYYKRIELEEKLPGLNSLASTVWHTPLLQMDLPLERQLKSIFIKNSLAVYNVLAMLNVQQYAVLKSYSQARGAPI